MAEEQGPGVGLKVLVVDDELSIRMIFDELLTDKGFEVEVAEDLASATTAFQETPFDLVVIDKNLPDGSGLDLARTVLDDSRDCEVVIMSAFANLESAVAAIQMGVTDYLVKPFDDLQTVVDRLLRAVERLTLKRENAALLCQLRDQNERLEQMVVRDSLTELFNHAYFQERLGNEIQRSSRHKHHFGLIFIDIDRFKEINDRLGHQVGDIVLTEISKTLRGESRATDDTFRLREHDLAARYGGDEFVLLLPETPKSGAAAKAERLRRHVEQRRFEDPRLEVTLSLGVAAFPEDATTRAGIIEAADTALYAAKRLGRNRVMGYTSSLTPPGAESPGTVDLPTKQLLALLGSIESGAFHAIFQPIVKADTFDLYGYEALGRPEDPAFPCIRDAIGAAERAGKILELGRVLRDKALEPIESLPDGCQLFINLHPNEIYDPELLAPDTRLHEWAERIVLEITETEAIHEFKRAKRIIEALRDKGFRVALDDLAGSYAGLSSLAQLEVDFVKIDRSMIQDIQSETRRARLIKHLLEYAKAEGILVISEGIKTQEDFEVTQQLGIPLMQGSFFAKGAPPWARVQKRPSA